jgi:hypothetical protein
MKTAKLLWLKIAPNFPLLADRVIKQRQAGVYCE